MGSGGARARSGPQKDPTSGRSERSGYKATALPSEGRPGSAPSFPLPKIHRYTFVDKMPVPDRGASTSFRARELAIWRESWKTPQACMWESQKWRWPTIAEFCRLKAVIELEPSANAALVARLKEYRQEIGLSRDGLVLNGWAIAEDEVGKKRQERDDAEREGTAAAPPRRMRKQSPPA